MLVAQKNEIVALDIVSERVTLLNKKKSSIADHGIEDFWQTSNLTLKQLQCNAHLVRKTSQLSIIMCRI